MTKKKKGSAPYANHLVISFVSPGEYIPDTKPSWMEERKPKREGTGKNMESKLLDGQFRSVIQKVLCTHNFFFELATVRTRFLKGGIPTTLTSFHFRKGVCCSPLSTEQIVQAKAAFLKALEKEWQECKTYCHKGTDVVQAIRFF